jgi:hypothetical protein
VLHFVQPYKCYQKWTVLEIQNDKDHTEDLFGDQRKANLIYDETEESNHRIGHGSARKRNNVTEARVSVRTNTHMRTQIHTHTHIHTRARISTHAHARIFVFMTATLSNCTKLSIIKMLGAVVRSYGLLSFRSILSWSS